MTEESLEATAVRASSSEESSTVTTTSPSEATTTFDNITLSKLSTDDGGEQFSTPTAAQVDIEDEKILPKIYQLCICGSTGRLFIANASVSCSESEGSLLC
jgi:hypothetical protein